MKPSKPRSARGSVLLKKIKDPWAVDQKYGLHDVSEILRKKVRSEGTTPLKPRKSARSESRTGLTYLDAAKREHVVFAPTPGAAPGLRCWWCRLQIPEKVLPLGCPVKYVTQTVPVEHISEVNRELFSIDEEELYGRKEQFQTRGCFCSFECCLSWIRSNRADTSLRLSESLLNRMYSLAFGVTGDKVPAIKEARSWQLLREYGGPLSEEEFRRGGSLRLLEQSHSFEQLTSSTVVSAPKTKW